MRVLDLYCDKGSDSLGLVKRRLAGVVVVDE